MVDEKLVIYIKECMGMGYSLDYIKQMLVSEGWKASQVDEAINFIQSPAPPPPGLPAQAKQKAPSKKPSKSPRPMGVTIICILGFLASVLALLTGIVSLGLAEIMGGLDIPLTVGNETASVTFGEFISLFTILGLVALVTGVAGLVAFYLLLKMKMAGWVIVTVLGIIQIAVSLIPSLISFSIEGLLNLDTIMTVAIWVVIIAYLFTKRKLFV